MALKYLNKTSLRTRRLIREEFGRMLASGKDIDDISVTELVKNIDITRVTFYQHYKNIQDIYEDMKSTAINAFIHNIQIKNRDDIKSFFAKLKKFLDEYENVVKNLLTNREAAFYVLNLSSKVRDMFFDFFVKKTKNEDEKKWLHIYLSIISDGLALQIIRFYDGSSKNSRDELINFAENKTLNLFKKLSK